MKKTVKTTITNIEEDLDSNNVTITLDTNTYQSTDKAIITDNDSLSIQTTNITNKVTSTNTMGDIIYYVTDKGKRVKKVLTKEVEDSLIEIAKDLSIDIETRKEAFSHLLLAYDKYIRHLVSKNYKYSKVNEDDITQAAFFGFIEAVKSYDVEKANGARLITYAYYQIKKYVSRLISSLGYATKTITTKDASHARTLILQIKAKRDLTQQDYENIASKLNNKTASWVRGIEQSLVRAKSFDNDTDDENEFNNPNNTLVDENSDFASDIIETEQCKQIRKVFFEAFYQVLDEREQDIIKNRVAEDFFEDVTEKATLIDLAKKYNVSNERIRQIENKAKEKLQKYLIQFMSKD